MQNSETNEQDVIAPGAIASGAWSSNRINPCGTVAPHSSQVAGETTTIILHTTEGGDQAESHKRYSRNSSHVHEAMRLLATYQYMPVRLAESSLPISIIGFKQDDPLLVFVISARKTGPERRPAPRGFQRPRGISLPHGRQHALPDYDLGTLPGLRLEILHSLSRRPRI